ncbi:MAG: histidine phosphatase family protein [Treponema sp.]|nr:histidine phosphatase family protein [Treponema sp.]
MRLIFIRHGDPDYEHDTITEKGKREADLLTKRTSKWKNITQIYVSPMGRAADTAKGTLQALNKQGITKDWLQEFKHNIDEPYNPELTTTWDLYPEYYTDHRKFFDKDEWTSTKLMKHADIKNYYKKVCDGIDEILASYGYIRNKKGFYNVVSPNPDNPNFDPEIKKPQLISVKDLKEDCTLVFFCHLGVMFAIIAHLIGCSPMQLWQGMYVAPTSVTILNSEERIFGQSFFRVERLGDTQHLTCGGEKISSSGYYADVLQECE